MAKPRVFILRFPDTPFEIEKSSSEKPDPAMIRALDFFIDGLRKDKA